ncbi:MAG: ATP-binding protein [Candidatus Promineifilaceae bacterium]
MESVCLPGTLEALPDVGAFVARAAQKAGLDNHAAYKLRLAVDEIATNSVVHGYDRAGQEGDLSLTAELTADRVIVILRESSPPYDPRQTPPPEDLDQPPDRRPAGGLGVYLALQGVDAFDYAYRKGQNCHTFVMNRTS